MTEVYVEGKRLRLDPASAVGKGGEADIFDVGAGRVLKLFKPPSHPDVAIDPAAAKAASHRIAEQQTKLPALMALTTALPPSVVLPLELATDRAGKALGYTMPFLSGAEVLFRYGQRDFRLSVPTDEAIGVLRQLHGVVTAVHKAQVVIGDFNDLNVLVKDRQPYLIDADSMQFGPFPCVAYTTAFVDPLLCDPGAPEPLLSAPHSMASDWYAFAVMVMQTLLFVGPYGGIYRPKDAKRAVPHPVRPLKRITVFHADVRYPKPALPYAVLPDDLLHHLQQVFERDTRGPFPVTLLERLRWTKCTACGAEHGRPTCPQCKAVAPFAVKETVVVRGQVTATRVFATQGTIVWVESHGGRLHWLYHEGGKLLREGGAVLGAMNPDPQMRYRLRPRSTFLGRGPVVMELSREAPPRRIDVDTVSGRPSFDVNETGPFWAHEGILYREGAFGPERVGDVLRGQTYLWVGPAFGFGFYRAGNVSVAFLFNTTGHGINDGVKLPAAPGQLLDATCTFTKDRVWVFTSSKEGPDTVNRCAVLRANGDVEATAEAKHGDGSWLGQIHGSATAGGSVLLMPTDDGVVQVKTDGTYLVEAERFPDTESFVDSGSKLFALADGLYVASEKTITRMVIARKG